MGRKLPRPFSILKLLIPGIGIKRWAILVLVGSALIGLGTAFLVVEIYRARPAALWHYVVWLSAAPLWLLALIISVVGGGLVLLSIAQINQSFFKALDIDTPDAINVMVEQKQRQRGPRIIAIGGGTGLPALLRGLKAHTSNLTAIITVADDGGSSGLLRSELGVIPPGDFRNNIAALARDEGLMTQLFQYRFGQGGLDGHSFGNLFISAMSSITGSFEEALVESSRVLAVRGKVLPSTLTDVRLVADIRERKTGILRRVVGESVIPTVDGVISRIALEPENAPAYPEAVKAILSANIIVLGPGSLYTSIMPNLLVTGLVDALRASPAPIVYVCNVATQPGETDGFTVLDHVKAIEQHIGPGVLTHVLVNNHFPPLDADSKTEYVTHVNLNEHSDIAIEVYEAPLVDEVSPWRHNSKQLAGAIIDLLTSLQLK